MKNICLFILALFFSFMIPLTISAQPTPPHHENPPHKEHHVNLPPPPLPPMHIERCRTVWWPIPHKVCEHVVIQRGYRPIPPPPPMKHHKQGPPPSMPKHHK